jgi:Xaa-Pro aminopeptidase
MVLVDGGGVRTFSILGTDCDTNRLQEWGTYISDITRTWPVNGKFSDPQRDLYNAVLNVHRSCVSLCRESAGLSLDKLHSIAENGLKDQLQQLGFDVSGSVSRLDVKVPIRQADPCLPRTGNGHPFPSSSGTLHWVRCS